MSTFSLSYLSIGSGHRMAAVAVGEAICRLSPGAQVDAGDPLARRLPAFPALANLGLAWEMRYGGARYDAHWRSGDVRLVSWAARQKWLAGGSPRGDIAAASHVACLRMALAQRERSGLPRKIFGVVTDFGLHGYWPVDGVDGYFVAGEELRQEFVRRGAAAEQVAVTGIPLRLDFASADIWQPRRAGGPLRVLVLAGGISSGAYAINQAWIEALLAKLQAAVAAVRFTIITGDRKKLLAGLEGLARRTRFELYPRGLVGDMAGVMRSHDLLIAKPGGLTVAEALACGLPLAALRPGPGQETANSAFLARQGVWLEAFTPGQAAEAIHRGVEDPDWLADLSRHCKALGRPQAALDAARRMLEEAQ